MVWAGCVVYRCDAQSADLRWILDLSKKRVNMARRVHKHRSKFGQMVAERMAAKAERRIQAGATYAAVTAEFRPPIFTIWSHDVVNQVRGDVRCWRSMWVGAGIGREGEQAAHTDGGPSGQNTQKGVPGTAAVICQCTRRRAATRHAPRLDLTYFEIA